MENLNLYPELSDEKEDIEPQKSVQFEHSIEIRDLCFKFPGAYQNTINNINISINKGEKIGIVGSSGSGKTTLMNVLLRFFKEQQGAVIVDDNALQDNQTVSWRNLIGYVKQDIFLMDASIKDNITFGEKIPDELRLEKAINQASLNQLIDSLPEGINTQIGERGSKLSGGQRQRISIARSLYRNAEILIFDEATSALDNQTEQEVSEAIDSLSEVHKTIFIIAHRITTLRNCDRIYELKDGKVAGVYSYQELVEKVL